MQSQTGKMQRQRWLNRLFGLIVCASLMLSSIAAAPYSQPAQEPASAQEPTPAAEPAVSTAAAQVPTDSSRVNYHRIIIKFSQGADVALQGPGLVSASGADLSPVQQALQGLELRPVFSSAAKLMGKMQASAAVANPANIPALDQYFYIELKPEATFEEAQALLTQLLSDPLIELAHMEPIYRPASSNQIAVDLTDSQGYLGPAADGGLDAEYAWTLKNNGSLGTGVKMIDIEEGWQIGHEDLPISTSNLIESSNSSDQNWVNHGAAVVGIIAGKVNDKGITGIAPDTYVRLISTVNFLTPDAILKAVENSQAGDIIVISEQSLGPVSEQKCPDGCDCAAFENVPVEYWQENFDAIYAATQLGIIVVEAAGNGAMNLDSTLYKGYFNRNTRDSGALMVGAGTPDVTHAPVCDANYGKRIDLQGWGSGVVTAGYGDNPDSGDNPNEYYTSTFGGSSAATAMVAGAVSTLQGLAKNRGYVLTPDQVRSILRSSGVAQGADTDKPIGPMPNLKDAIDKKLTAGVVLLSPADNSTVRTLLPTLDWQDYFNATQYQIQIAKDSGFNTIVFDKITTSSEITLTTKLSASIPLYYWHVRPYVNDVWENWSTNIFRFSVDATSAPAITALGKPISGAVITNADNFRPEFTWKAPTNIPDGYEIMISVNYDLSDGIDAYVPENSYIPAAGLTPNRRYYWRVRSYFGTPPDDASFGPWTGRRVFYTALDAAGLDPLAITANEDTLRPTFDWSDVDSAKAYQIQFSTSSTFGTASTATISLPSGETVVPSEYKRTVDLPRARDMYWRVRVKGNYGWSSWVNAADFFTTPNPPYVPTLGIPALDAKSSTWETGMLFTWSKPGGSPDTFHLQIATDKLFENIAFDITDIPIPDPTEAIKVPNTTVNGLEAENVYYWRVRAIGDGAGNWSAIRRFYTTPPAPTGLNVESNDTLRPTFSWDKVDVARAYNIQVVKDNPNVPDEDKYKLFAGTRIIVNNFTASSPPFMIATSLPRTNPDTEPDKSFLWRVRAGGLYGYGAWSEISTVTTPNPPNTPEVVSPANGANLSNFSPLLDWYSSVKVLGNPASNAADYQVQVSNRSNFVIIDPENDTLLEFSEDDITGTSYQLSTTALPTAGTYYWHVRAVSESGEYSLWSPTRSFNTPGMVSGEVTDALTGDPLRNVTIQVAGRVMQTTTDMDGKFTIRGMPAGTFTLIAAGSGYMRQSVSVSSNYAANRTRNIALAPIPEDGQIRIAVTWGGAPADLDAHLWLPATNKAHIYKDNLGGDEPQAIMELTDSDGYGPEIITLTGTFSGKYVFAVYTPDSVDKLAISKARVTIYNGSDYIGAINITDAGSGHWWRAFTLDGSTRKITVQNVITNTNPAPYADIPAP